MSRFYADRLARAFRLLRRLVDEDRLPAVAALVGSSAEFEEPRYFGRQDLTAGGDLPEFRPLGPDSLFLIASPTKPIAAMAVMMLVEQGDLRLADPVAAYLPEFAGQGKRGITLGHCLTHTSGLPDMLPDNAELRSSQAPLSAFLERTCQLKPEFTPGHRVQYQSMGYLVLGEVVHRVAGEPLPEFLARRIFEPLAMSDTALGMPEGWEQTTDRAAGPPRARRIAEIRLPEGADGHSACWNTTYWRRLGAPWGGLLSTPRDLALLSQHLLGILRSGQDGVLSQAALSAMTSNQLALMSDVPESNRRCQPWGLGWQLNWPTHATAFSEILSPGAFGHWGATGTLVWIDPARDIFAVVLSTEPLQRSQRLLTRFSNAVAAALR